jgi:hypothetical protein
MHLGGFYYTNINRKIRHELFGRSSLREIIQLLNSTPLNLLKPIDHVMYHQFNIQQLYALPTLYLCVLYLSENKHLLVPLTA